MTPTSPSVTSSLGRIEQERNKSDESEEWYRKALEIYERLGLERDAAGDYHQLGIIAEERGRFDEAERWFTKALEIFERLHLEQDAAAEYHHLGIFAQERGRFDEAEGWYRKALEIFERLGHRSRRVNTLAQLGSLRLFQNRHRESVAWYGSALIIAADYQMPVLRQILVNLARIVNQLGEEKFTSAWKGAFDGQAPPLEAIRQVAEQLPSDES